MCNTMVIIKGYSGQVSELTKAVGQVAPEED